MGGFWEAKITPKSSFCDAFSGSFSKPDFLLIFNGFSEWRHAFRLAVAQSKRISAILDDAPKNVKKLVNFET